MRDGNYQRGEDRYNSILTAVDVALMRTEHYDDGIPISRIAQTYKISYKYAWDIINYRRWQHVS